MASASTLLPAIAVGALVGVPALMLWQRYREFRRERYIRDAPLPLGLLDRLAKRRPELSLKDRALVAHALRQFFLVHLRARGKFVSMPSQVVDDLWHEFILYTKAYREYCGKAFGRFFDHTPAVALAADKRNNAGLRRTWWYACKEEHIEPRRPSRLPLLFAIDAKLGIDDGFVARLPRGACIRRAFDPLRRRFRRFEHRRLDRGLRRQRRERCEQCERLRWR